MMIEFIGFSIAIILIIVELVILFKMDHHMKSMDDHSVKLDQHIIELDNHIKKLDKHLIEIRKVKKLKHTK